MADEDSAAVEASSAEAIDWRQCSLCTPQNPGVLPATLAFEPGKDLLLISTQTCSLVGKGAEPAFEVFAVALVEGFDSLAAEAKGKITRFLQLALDGDAAGRGIRLDVSRRSILSSQLLHQMQPEQFRVSDDEVKAFQGWIARYYSRIALPDELDRCLRNRKFHRKVEKALSHTLMDETTDYKVHTDIDKIYVAWEPDRELSADETYTFKMLIVCRRPGTREHLLAELSGLASGVKTAPLTHGVRMDDPDAVLANDVTVKQVSKMKRFTSFDEFSSLAEVARAMTDQ